MSKHILIERWECEVCHSQYLTELEAINCESVPISGNKGAKVGMPVKISGDLIKKWGEKDGTITTVREVAILGGPNVSCEKGESFTRYYGNPARNEEKRHSVVVTVRPGCVGLVLDSDSYELVEKDSL